VREGGSSATRDPSVQRSPHNRCPRLDENFRKHFPFARVTCSCLHQNHGVGPVVTDNHVPGVDIAMKNTVFMKRSVGFQYDHAQRDEFLEFSALP
jgi:hypothetical protein